jgi:hypothetical protein
VRSIPPVPKQELGNEVKLNPEPFEGPPMLQAPNRRFRSIVALLLTFSGLAAGNLLPAATFVVAPGGRDDNPGTPEAPKATLSAARDAARAAGGKPHRIIVMPGDYFLTSPLVLDWQDNGLSIEAGEGGQATLYGGALVTGWRPEGDKLWSAAVAGVKEGSWDFRALVVNGRMPDRARLPASGEFLHRSVFDVSWLSTVGGGWDRKPTPEELTTLLYDPKDIPPSLDVRSAEVRVYHMWDESTVGLSAIDTQRHALLFSTPAKSPPGAFGVKKYVIFNTREGLTRPGQWCLDRTAGSIVYWPLAGEDMTGAKVVAPRLERILHVAGTRQKPVEDIAIRGLKFRATTTPLKPGGFGAYAYDGAVRVELASRCALEGLDIGCVGGQGLIAEQLNDCRITGCRIHHTGACGIKTSGSGTLLANNHIHDIGVSYPSAIALSVHGSRNDKGKGFHIYRNEIHDAPYSGISGDGEGLLIEQNLIYRVMRELQDGAAIYGGMRESILRGNIVRDVVKTGEGYGVSAYYLDEGARDCIVEGNVSVGVARPSHNHIATNITIRDNVFIAEGDMSLSFQRSAGCTVEGNTFFAPGKLSVAPPGAVTVWKDNAVFHNGTGQDGSPQPFTIDDRLPPAAQPQRMTWSAGAAQVAKPPEIDGEIGSGEWPGELVRLDRTPTRWSASGAPVYARLAYDDEFLYVALNVVTFDASKLSSGAAWGRDDGAELAIAGKSAGGQAVIYVVRGYPGGALESTGEAGAPAADAERLAAGLKFGAKPYGKARGGWRAELAVPWKTLGQKPEAGLKMPFNLTVYRSQDDVWRCWEGTLAESWRLDQAGTLQLK